MSFREGIIRHGWIGGVCFDSSIDTKLTIKL